MTAVSFWPITHSRPWGWKVRIQLISFKFFFFVDGMTGFLVLQKLNMFVVADHLSAQIQGTLPPIVFSVDAEQYSRREAATIILWGIEEAMR